MTGLREILEHGLPEAPPLDGLAGRVESGVRRRRVRRRAGLVVAAAVAVGAVLVAVPQVRSDPRPEVAQAPATTTPAPPSGTPAPAVSQDCVAAAARVPTYDVPPPPDRAVSVRFCPVPAASAALVPETTLTGVDPELVAVLRGTSSRSFCVSYPRRDFRAQIAYADGTTEEVTYLNGRCGDGYVALMGAIADQESTGAALTRPTPACPSLRDRRAGMSRARMGDRLEGSVLLTERAVTGVVCRYDTGAVVPTPLDQPGEAESLRIALLGHHYLPNAMTKCGYPPERDVVVVLTLDDASTHRALIGGCGDTTVGASHLGLARRALPLPS